MDLHLHLSVAFRALDRKWGKGIDLDTSGGLPAYPAMVERPTTTFSSEEFLRNRVQRPKPYSRPEERRRRRSNVKVNDSFADISHHIVEATSVDSGLDSSGTEILESSGSLNIDFKEQLCSGSRDSGLDKCEGATRKWSAAKSYLLKCKRKLRN